MRQLIAAALAAALIGGAARAQTVVLVRHAEKTVEPAADPVLTPEGEARARALAQALAGAKISLVLTSPLQRTIRTAAPLAAAGAPTRAVPLQGGTQAHVAALAALARAEPAEATVVIVGHSNTIPLIARALGHATASDIPDCRYDNLLVLRLAPAGTATVDARYGAPSAGC